MLIFKVVIVVLVVLIGVLSFFVVKGNMGRKKSGTKPETESQSMVSTEETVPTESRIETETLASEDIIIEQADRLAAMYDYDAAIELLKSSHGFESNATLMTRVNEYEAVKETLVEYPLDEITHVFYHTLIKDASLAFDGDDKEAGYNQVMTTIDEFNKITQNMYDKGYVMVSLHDMVTVNDDGTVTRNKIMLPPGKKAFVLSQDDVSYYHYMEGDGMATKLIIDENGSVKNEYIETDGSISIGDFDMVPLIDTFVDAHPEFSYHGAKGVIALTGYNGVLGYRTDIAYKTREELQDVQEKFFEQNPDFNENSYQHEIEEATKVATAMKEDGWEFASHTWGHLNVKEADVERIKTDTEKWINYVEPIIGKTDIIIFAFGADIAEWYESYTRDNPKFAYLKEAGFDIFCNVDSAQYWVQMADDYLRQGRRNLDGYRLYYNPELLDDLFDASEVFDSARPTPVPPM